MSTNKITSSIEIKVGLNEDKIPDLLEWKSSEGVHRGEYQEVKAMLLSLFDKNSKETLKIDLWTTEMQIVEMDRFMFQTLRALGDTYYKATGNTTLASDFQKFVEYFGQQTGIIPLDDPN
jgi:gliding motility-associated protein GldC